MAQEQKSRTTKSLLMPQIIYNLITAMGFLALDYTIRGKHCWSLIAVVVDHLGTGYFIDWGKNTAD